MNAKDAVNRLPSEGTPSAEATAVPAVDPPDGLDPVVYPEPLRRSLARARATLAAVFFATGGLPFERRSNEPTRAAIWLIGRDGEIRAFASCCIDDWRAGRVRIEDAAESLRRYLDAINQGLLRHAPCAEGVERASKRSELAENAALPNGMMSTVDAGALRDVWPGTATRGAGARSGW